MGGGGWGKGAVGGRGCSGRVPWRYSHARLAFFPRFTGHPPPAPPRPAQASVIVMSPTRVEASAEREASLSAPVLDSLMTPPSRHWLPPNRPIPWRMRPYRWIFGRSATPARLSDGVSVSIGFALREAFPPGV